MSHNVVFCMQVCGAHSRSGAHPGKGTALSISHACPPCLVGPWAVCLLPAEAAGARLPSGPSVLLPTPQCPALLLSRGVAGVAGVPVPKPFDPGHLKASCSLLPNLKK